MERILNFLDAIGERIYPIIAGQIAVGCCFRPDAETFKCQKMERHLITYPIFIYSDCKHKKIK